MAAPQRLELGLLVGADDLFAWVQPLAIPAARRDPNAAGLDGEVGVARKHPRAPRPRPDRVLRQPSPDRRPGDLADDPRATPQRRSQPSTSARSAGPTWPAARTDAGLTGEGSWHSPGQGRASEPLQPPGAVNSPSDCATSTTASRPPIVLPRWRVCSGKPAVSSSPGRSMGVAHAPAPLAGGPPRASTRRAPGSREQIMGRSVRVSLREALVEGPSVRVTLRPSGALPCAAGWTAATGNYGSGGVA